MKSMSKVSTSSLGRVALAFAALSLAPSSAAAFDTFEAFGAPVVGVAADPPADPPVEPRHGGGGGRYFTGSLSDGYSCAVCHFGGTPDPEDIEDIEFVITPDPIDGYRQGDTFEILITVPNTIQTWAATLELVDTRGEGAGDLELVPVSAQSTADQCAIETRPDDLIAAHIVNLVDPPREVAGVDTCGARQLRVTWEAPDAAIGAVWLNSILVVADGTGDAANDFTIEFARVIPAFGTNPNAGRVTNACAASPGHGSNLPAFAGLALVLFRVARRRRSASR